MSRRQVFPQLFLVLLNFQECFYNLIETWRTFSISFRKRRNENKGNYLCFFTLIIKMQILFACTIITLTAQTLSSG